MYIDDDSNSVFHVIRNIEPSLLELNYYRRYNNWGREPHSHEFMQFLYVTSGELSIRIDDKTYELRKGDMSLIPPKCSHEIYTNSEYEQVGANIQLSNGAGMMGLNALLKQHVPKPAVLHGSELMNHAEAVKKMLGNATSINATKAAYRVGRMLLHVLDMLMTNDEEDIVEQLLDYFNEHMGEKLRVQDIAQDFHISVSHLERVVHSHFSMGLIALYNKMRVDYACKLLINSNLPIGEVAMRVGFSEGAAFSGFFSRYEGQPPSSYRAQRQRE